MKYITHEAKKLGTDAALVLLDVGNRIVCMVAGETGRALDDRARRSVRAALVEGGTAPPPRVRRTSRPERRTSRPAKKKW